MLSFCRNVALAASVFLFAVPAFADPPVVVFAAASLTTALNNASAPFATASGDQLKISYGGSLGLARQIESGAPADVFISADQDLMDDAAKKNAIKADTRFDYLRNTLVVIAPKDSPLTSLDFTADALKAALGAGKLSTGEVSTVPIGKYAKAALTKLGLWDIVAPQLAMSDNVRAALEFVARGESPIGIVYATDAAAEPRVKVIATFPEDLHPPIIYPAALTASTTNPGAAKLIEFLRSDPGRKFFEAQGFQTIK